MRYVPTCSDDEPANEPIRRHLSKRSRKSAEQIESEKLRRRNGKLESGLTKPD